MASTIKVNNIQNQCGANIVNKCSTTITLGASGDNIVLASGATQSGFGRSGTVDWDTTAKTSGFTAVSGTGYFINTTSGAITVTLPASPSAGDIVSLSDYTNTWATNNVTVANNGEPIGGVSANALLSTEGQSVTFVYVDGTEGWKNIQDSTSNVTGNPFISATGGTITTCGNCKIHTFTGPGTFCVSQVHPCAANNRVSYLVVAGGGGGGFDVGGGGGAGGFREDKSPVTPYTASPLNGAGSITVSATSYPISVGSGGTGSTSGSTKGSSGSNSIFSTITSAGGGGGGSYNTNVDGASGGSGGGGAGYVVTSSGGSGNTPPVSPSQGNNGGGNSIPSTYSSGGGGGGAGGAGANQYTNPTTPLNGTAAGGPGVATSITASPVTYSAGGRGVSDQTPSPLSGSANTGNAGDGGGIPCTGGSGGSGIVVIRYKYK